jgi:hypothetical protein
MRPATLSPTKARTPGPCRRTSAIGTSPTPCDTRSSRRAASGTFGKIEQLAFSGHRRPCPPKARGSTSDRLACGSLKQARSIAFFSELHALRIDLYPHQQGVDTSFPARKALPLQLLDSGRLGLLLTRSQRSALGRRSPIGARDERAQ